MIVRLKDIASIKSGLVLSRARYDTSQMAKAKKYYKTLSLKSFDKSGYFESSYSEEFISKVDIKNEYLLQKDDILVRFSSPNTSVYIHKDFSDTIISSLVAAIRVKSSNISPCYLVSYLNSSFAKRDFLRYSTALMLTVKNLEDIKIPLPPLKTQEKIVSFQALAHKEIRLLRGLIVQKERYSAKIFDKAIKKELKNV